MMSVVRRTAPAETVITVAGAFDRDAATRLEALVNEVALEALLTLDFREVRLFHDSAVASLAHALSSHPNARLVGLSQHHYRLLRYFGDEVALSGAETAHDAS
jgi:hypothetical protein